MKSCSPGLVEESEPTSPYHLSAAGKWETMTTDDVRDHVDAVIAADEDRYGRPVAKGWMRRQAVPKLLPTLRRSYDAALREEEIVIYWLG